MDTCIICPTCKMDREQWRVMFSRTKADKHDIDQMEKKCSVYRLDDLCELEQHYLSISHKYWYIITALVSVLFIESLCLAAYVGPYGMTNIVLILPATSVMLIVPLTILYKKVKDASDKANALYGLTLKRQVKMRMR